MKNIITEGINKEYELQYSHLYAPRRLREIVYAVDQSGKSLYGSSKVDLKKINDTEASSSDHSPIIGWAYDGNPIYGPYGFENKNGSGRIVKMVSGYSKVTMENRRPLPDGIFVEDL